MEICYKTRIQVTKDKTLVWDEQIKKPSDIIAFLDSIEHYNMCPTENIIIVALNNRNEPVAYSEIAKGAPGFCNFSMPSLFQVILMANASKFILAHNHPTGNSKPSDIDIQMTKDIKKASDLMHIKFVDHIVIGDDEYTSIFSECNI